MSDQWQSTRFVQLTDCLANIAYLTFNKLFLKCIHHLTSSHKRVNLFSFILFSRMRLMVKIMFLLMIYTKHASSADKHAALVNYHRHVLILSHTKLTNMFVY